MVLSPEGKHGGKLLLKDVYLIRQLLAKGKLLQREIAAFFEVSEQTINDIKNGYTWTHI